MTCEKVRFLVRGVLKTCSLVLNLGVDLEASALAMNPNVNQICIENTAIPSVLHLRSDAATRLRQRPNLDGCPLVDYIGNLERCQGWICSLSARTLEDYER